MECIMAKGTITIIAAGVFTVMAAGTLAFAASQKPDSNGNAASFKIAGPGGYEVTKVMEQWGVNSRAFRAPTSPDYPCCGYIHSDTPYR